MYVYRLYLSDFKDNLAVLAQALNINATIEDFKAVDFVVINEDRMKFTVDKGDEVAANVALRVVMNP